MEQYNVNNGFKCNRSSSWRLSVANLTGKSMKTLCTMTTSRKGLCLGIFGLLIVITFLVYFNLYADITLWVMSVMPLRNERLADFYGKLNGAGIDEKLSIESQIKRELKIRLKAAAADKKIILFWAPAFGSTTPVSSPNIKECGNCDITYDRSLIDDHRTAAILYHFDSVKSWDMPPKRNPNHLHIFWSMEASSTLQQAKFTLGTEEKYGMNATMTYRRDSDFLTSYGGGAYLAPLAGHNASIYHKIMKDKSKLALAVISDCAATKGAIIRVALTKQLKEAGLRIDTYGKCFSNWIDGDVLKDSIHRYKFYFAYENSYHCKDYITEKFFSYALTYNTVPVVWGATKEDYEAIAPPGSFIHSEDFNSPEDLIRYLNFLDKNDTEYMKYFRWRTMKAEDLPIYHRKSGFCAICRALHGINVDYRFNPSYVPLSIPLFSDGVAKREVPSLQKFIFGDENPECLHIK